MTFYLHLGHNCVIKSTRSCDLISHVSAFTRIIQSMELRYRFVTVSFPAGFNVGGPRFGPKKETVVIREAKSRVDMNRVEVISLLHMLVAMRIKVLSPLVGV